MSKIVRFAKGVHLFTPELKFAYVQGREVRVERIGLPTLKFGTQSADEADRLASKINEHINASNVGAGTGSDTIRASTLGESGSENDDVPVLDERELHREDHEAE